MPIKNKSGFSGKIRLLRKKTYRALVKKPKRISIKIRHFLTIHKKPKQNPKRKNRVTKITPFRIEHAKLNDKRYKRGGLGFNPFKKNPPTDSVTLPTSTENNGPEQPKPSLFGKVGSFVSNKINQTRKNVSDLKKNIGNKTQKSLESIQKVGTSINNVGTKFVKGEYKIAENLKTVLKDPNAVLKAVIGFKNKFVGLMKEVSNPVNVEGGGFLNSFFLQYLDIRSVKMVYNLNVDKSITDGIIQDIKNKNPNYKENPDQQQYYPEQLDQPQSNLSQEGGEDGNPQKDIDVFIGGLTNSFYIYQKDENQKPIGNYISFGALNRATIIDQKTFEELVTIDKYKGAGLTNTGYVCFSKEFEPFYRLLMIIKFNLNRFLWTAKSAKVTADLTVDAIKGIIPAMVSGAKGIFAIQSNLRHSEAAVQDNPSQTNKKTEEESADPADLGTIFEEPFYYLLIQMKKMCLDSSNETFKKEVKSGAQSDAIKNGDTCTATKDVASAAVQTTITTQQQPNIGGNRKSLSSNQNQQQIQAGTLSSPSHNIVQKGGIGIDGLTGRIKRVLKTFFEFEDKGWGGTSFFRKVTGFDRNFPIFMKHEASIALLQALTLLNHLNNRLIEGKTITDIINDKKLLEKSNFINEFNSAKCNEVTISLEPNKKINLSNLDDFESNKELVAFLDQEEQSINSLAKKISAMAENFTKFDVGTKSKNAANAVKEGFNSVTNFFTRKNQPTTTGGKRRKQKSHRRTQKGGLFIFPDRFREIMECCFNYAYQQMVGRIMKRLTKISENSIPPTGENVVLASKKVPMQRHLVNFYSKYRFAIFMGFQRSFFSIGNWMLPVGATPHLMIYTYILSLSVYHDIAYASDPDFSREFIALNGKIIFKTLLPAGKKLPISDEVVNPYKFFVIGHILNDGANGLNIQNNTIVIPINNGLISLSLQSGPSDKTQIYKYVDSASKPIFFAQNGLFVGSIYAIEQNGEECSIQFKKWKYDNKKTNLVPVEGGDKSIVNKYFYLADKTSYLALEFNQVIPYVFQSPNYYLNDDTSLNKNHVHTHIPLTYETINIINASSSESHPECTTIQTNGVDTFSPSCEYAVNYIYLGKVQKISTSTNILRGNDLEIECDMFDKSAVTKPVMGNLELYKVKPYMSL